MTLRLTSEQKSYASDKAKLRNLAIWVLGDRHFSLTQKCRREIGVLKYDSKPAEPRIKKMSAYLLLDISRPTFAKLVNGYLQSQ